MELIIALIFTISVEMGLPSNFVLAVALTENPTLDPLAVNINDNGSIDRGVLQLNSFWYNDSNWYEPETNIRAGCQQILWIISLPEVNTWWTVAVVYNCGYDRFLIQPPDSTLDYAARVMARYTELSGGYASNVIQYDTRKRAYR